MAATERLEKGFLETLGILKDVLPQIVIVGGWCPWLYANYVWKRRVPAIPTTLDIDLGVLETGARRFDRTVYERLRAAGLVLERLYEGEETPIEFIYRKKAVELKIEFITSFETTDDTLNRFLGSELACNRIEAFELLLRDPVLISVRSGKQHVTVRIPPPPSFFYHKGITFVMRSEDFKRAKDLFYVYFMLRYTPSPETLLDPLEEKRGDEYFGSFRDNIREYLKDTAAPGYLMLRPFLEMAVPAAEVNEDIRRTFAPLLERLG